MTRYFSIAGVCLLVLALSAACVVAPGYRHDRHGDGRYYDDNHRWNHSDQDHRYRHGHDYPGPWNGSYGR